MNKHTVGLVRVSTDKQKTATQHTAMRRLAEARKLQLVPLDKYLAFKEQWDRADNLLIVCEDKVTGRHTDRDGYKWALMMVQGGWCREVVVYNIDRIGRSMKNNFDFAHHCLERKVRLYGIMDNTDISTPEGRLKYNLLSSMAEYQRELIVENTKAGIAERMNTCAKCGKHKDYHKGTNRCQFEALRQGGTSKGWTYRTKLKDMKLFWSMVDQGCSNRHISRVLGWQPRTVRKYRLLGREYKPVTRKEMNTKVYGKSNAKV